MVVRKRRGNKNKKQQQQQQSNTNDSHDDNAIDNRSNVKKATKGNTSLTSISILLLMSISVFVYYNIKCYNDNTNKNEEALKRPNPLNKTNTNNTSSNITKWYLTNFICKESTSSGGYCHPNLKAIPRRRTHEASTPQGIPANETILVLPRKYIITDLDALKDEFIQDELFGVRHYLTNNSLDAGAYLAVHLLVRRERQMDSNSNTSDYMMPFFVMLPDETQLLNHPVFWPKQTLLALLGNTTLASQTVVAFRDMMLSEYHAFTSKSEQFKVLFSLQQYMLMRVHVITRSFGTGPPHTNEADAYLLTRIESETGVPIRQGCRAMAPILDMWNHHAKPNAQWHYDSKKQAFIVKSNGIPQGHDVMVSYGRYTDTHLFAKFGFVNGDGSGWTEASIATIHRLPDIGLGSQFSYPTQRGMDQDLIPYLQYDDGYPQCIQPTNTTTPNNKDPLEIITTLKRQKFEHVKLLSQVAKQWILHMPPRDDTVLPTPSSHELTYVNNYEIPNFNRNSKLDVKYLLSTCRLITMNQKDYDALSPTLLRNHTFIKVETNSNPGKQKHLLHIPKQSDDAEFFALSCLERLTAKALSYYPSDVTRDMNYLKQQHMNISFYKSKTWNAIHVRLAEMQTLEVLRNVAISGMREMLTRIQSRNKQNITTTDLTLFKVRKQPCPFEWSQLVLFNYTNNENKVEEEDINKEDEVI